MPGGAQGGVPAGQEILKYFSTFQLKYFCVVGEKESPAGGQASCEERLSPPLSPPLSPALSQPVIVHFIKNLFKLDEWLSIYALVITLSTGQYLVTRLEYNRIKIFYLVILE